jgi:hypothetical protein
MRGQFTTDFGISQAPDGPRASRHLSSFHQTATATRVGRAGGRSCHGNAMKYGRWAGKWCLSSRRVSLPLAWVRDGGAVALNLREIQAALTQNSLRQSGLCSASVSTRDHRSIQPSPATVCGKPIVVSASRPTSRTSSGVTSSASARRACERTAPSACAPIAIASFARRALRASRGPSS